MMVAVADDDAGMQTHAAQNFGRGAQRIGGGFAFLLHDDRFGRDAAIDQIGPAHAAFRE